MSTLKLQQRRKPGFNLDGTRRKKRKKEDRPRKKYELKHEFQVKRYSGNCEICGQAFKSSMPFTKYCSTKCRVHAGNSKKPKPGPWTRHRSTRPCKACAVEFLMKHPKHCFCSHRCQRAFHWERRRHLKARGTYINPIDVFERDGWRCQICGCKTPRKWRGTTNKRAPEVEHIVALSCGGTHTWGNVQCACRRCNALKGTATYGQINLNLHLQEPDF